MIRFLLDGVFNGVAVQVLHRGTGLLLAFQALFLLPDLPLLYGADGLVDHGLLPRSASTLSVGALASGTLSWTGLAPGRLLVFPVAGYLLLALLLAGRRLPWWGILLLALLHHAWFIGSPAFSYGADYLSASALFYCLCTCRPAQAWRAPAVRLLQLHLCLIYGFGGIAKAMGPTWWDGEAVWKAANQPYHLEHAPAAVAWLGHYPPIWVIAGWAVVLLETAYPLAVWIPRVRHYWLAGILAMHVGIALLMGLFHFAAVMILLNLVAFYYAYLPATSQPSYPSHNHPSPGGAPARKLWMPLRDDTTKGGITKTEALN